MINEIIDSNQVERTPKGRKPNYNSELLDLFKQMSEGKAVRLGKTYGRVRKENRSNVGAEIRKHWMKVRDDKPTIHFSEEGIPQVHIRENK